MISRVALDANRFIGAVTPGDPAYPALRRIIAARDEYRLAICVSLHTIHELKTPEALALAKTATELPHFAIGAWGDQVALWA